MQFTVRSMMFATALVAAFVLVVRSGPTLAGLVGFGLYYGLIAWKLGTKEGPRA